MGNIIEKVITNVWVINIMGGALAAVLAAFGIKYLIDRPPSALRLYRKALTQICDPAHLNITKDEKRVLQKTLRDKTVIETIKTRTADPSPEARILLETIARYAPPSSRLAGSTFASQVVAQLLDTEFGRNRTDETFHDDRQPYFEVPPPPQRLTLTPQPQQIILTWDSVQHPGISRYHIKRSNSLDRPFAELDSISASADTLSFTDTNGLADDTTYYYAISSESSVLKQSRLSSPVSIYYNRVSDQAISGINTFFTPREVWEEIASESINRGQELKNLLEDFNNDKRRLFLIGGFWGVGKTVLASRLATTVEKQYNVLWIDCQGIPVTVERFLRAIGFFAAEQYKYPLLHTVVEDSRFSPEEKNKELHNFLHHITDQFKSDTSVKPIAFFFDDYDRVEDEALKNLVRQIAESHWNVKVVLVIEERRPELEYEINAKRVEIRGLDIDGCREFIRKYDSEYPALRTIDDEKLRRIQELTGEGVPIALKTLISLTSRLSLDDVLNELPALGEATRKVWFDKLFSELSPDERQVATEASIFRRPISLRALIEMSHCARARESIIALVDRFVLAFDGKGYSMNVLWSDYTMQTLSRKESKELHRRAALLYRDLGAKDQYAEAIMSRLESCYHFIQAEDIEQAEETFLLIAHTLRSWGFYKEFTEILQEIEKNNRDKKKQLNPVLNLEKSTMLYDQGHVDDAVSALEELVDAETGKIKIRALNTLAWIKSKSGDQLDAERLFGRSRQLADQFKLPKLEGEALQGLFSIAYLESDYVKAREYNEQRLKLFQQSPDTYLDIGSVYREQGRYKEAMEYYQKDLELLGTLGDPPLNVGWLNYNMGQVLFGQKNWSEAQDKFEHALQCFEKMQHVDGIAHAKIELGRVSSKIDKSDKSVDIVKDVINVVHRVKLPIAEAYGLRALGEIYLNFREPDQALPYLQRSLEMDEQILHGVKGRACSLHRIGLAYEQKARQLLKKSAPLSEVISSFRKAQSAISEAQHIFEQLNTVPNFDDVLDDKYRIEQECAKYDRTNV